LARSDAELSRKLAIFEKKYDIQFKAVLDAIRELMTPLQPKKKRLIGFAPRLTLSASNPSTHPPPNLPLERGGSLPSSGLS